MAKRLGSRSAPLTQITVEWNYEHHSIRISHRNWSKVKIGKALTIRGKGYYYEGVFYWDYWHFSGGLDGSLLVEYGREGGVGFDGSLRDAAISPAL